MVDTHRAAVEAAQRGERHAQQERCSEREPADSLTDKSNVISGWLPSLTVVVRRNRLKMPTGDSARAWFPEMLEALEREWSFSLSWEECGALCDRMTEARTRLQRERGIKKSENAVPSLQSGS